MTRTTSSKHFQKLVLNWFHEHGRKHLPWQKNKTPYRVWLSEIMLQQTQVTTVIPYFEQFIKKFPDLLSLASAKEDEVLHLWAGLGYYSRARNLHRAAIMVKEKWNGIFPSSREELISLPGIGESTAGAILSLAFQQSAPILDGNVKRVLARFHAIRDPINEKEIEKKLWKFATQYTPKKDVASYTQAMMDLGATLCTPKNPQCHRCPLKSRCAAKHEGIAEILPLKKPKKILPIKRRTFLIIQCNEFVLLEKRTSKGIWGGLFSLPEIADLPDKKKIQLFCREYFGISAKTFSTILPFRHTFTHYHLDIHPVIVEIKALPTFLAKEKQIWYNLHSPEAFGLPKPVQLILGGLAYETHQLL